MITDYKTIKKQHYKYILLCTYQINRNGNVRIIFSYADKQLGIEQLELGKGLYLSVCLEKDNNMKDKLIYDICGPKGLIYRTLYFAFNDKIKGYQIHHKDYNHFNNTLDNIEYLTPKDHGLKHKWQSYLNNGDIKEEYLEEYNMYVKSKNIMNDIIDTYKYYTYKCSLNYLRELKTKYYNIALLYYNEDIQQRKLKKEQDKINKELLKQKELEEGLKNGTYRKRKDGKIVKKYKWSEEARESAKEKRKYMYTDEWRKKVKQSTTEACTTEEFRNKQRQITKTNMTPERRQRISNTLKEYNKNLSEEDRREHGRRIKEGIKNKKIKDAS